MEKKQRGGADTARRLGHKGIMVHVSLEDHDRLQAAAQAAGLVLKEFCRLAVLRAIGVKTEPRPDLRGSPGIKRQPG